MDYISFSSFFYLDHFVRYLYHNFVICW